MTKLTSILVIALLATPALATDVSKPDPTPEPAAAPSRSESKPERSNECPHDHVNRFGGCSAPRVSLRPKMRPVTDQTVPAGELK